MIFQILMLAVIILIAIILPLCIIYFGWRSFIDPVMGVKLALTLFIVNTFIPLPHLPLGVTIYFPDLLYLLLIFVGLFRLFSKLQFRLIHWLWLYMGIVFLSLFAVGLLRFKTIAGIEFRLVFPFWAGGLYLMTFQLSQEQVDKIVRAFVMTAAVMVPLICLRWAAMIAGLSIVRYWTDGVASLRVVGAGEALFLAQAFIIAFYVNLKDRGPKWWGWLIPILFCCIIVLQHRSVWVVTVISFLFIFFLLPNARGRFLKQFGIGTIIGLMLIGPLVATGKLDVLTDSLEHSVGEVSSKKSTFLWRLQSTEELVGGWAHSGPLVVLFGKPFGSGFERYLEVQKAKTNVAPHNHYVLILLRGGGLGLLSFLLVYLITVRHYIVSKVVYGRFLESRLLAVLLLGQLTYFLTYGAEDIQFVVAGLALALFTTFPADKKSDLA